MSGRRFVVLALLAAAAGCSALTPFATAPSPAPVGVKEPGSRVAICYNGLKTPPEKVQELAQAECLGNSVAELVETDYRLDNCPVATPGRATFLCRPK
jgi:hypothetical protein